MDRDGNVDRTKGGMTLVLAKATQADVRGCEVFINEAILDISNDQGSQFTNIPRYYSKCILRDWIKNWTTRSRI